MERLSGIGVSGGVAVGRAVILSQRTEVMRFPIPPDRVDQEVAALYAACNRSRQQLQDISARVARGPGNDLAANNLASVLLDTRDDKASFEQARKIAQRFERSPNPAYLDSLGWAHFRLGDYAQAIPLLQKAAERAPQAARILFDQQEFDLGAGDLR